MISISQMRLLRKLYRLTSERDGVEGRKGNLLSDEYLRSFSKEYGLERKLRVWYGMKEERQKKLDIRMEKLKAKGLIVFRNTEYDYVRITLMGEDCAKHPVRDYLIYCFGTLAIPTISALLATFISDLFKR